MNHINKPNEWGHIASFKVTLLLVSSMVVIFARNFDIRGMSKLGAEFAWCNSAPVPRDNFLTAEFRSSAFEYNCISYYYIVCQSSCFLRFGVFSLVVHIWCFFLTVCSSFIYICNLNFPKRYVVWIWIVIVVGLRLTSRPTATLIAFNGCYTVDIL